MLILTVKFFQTVWGRWAHSCAPYKDVEEPATRPCALYKDVEEPETHGILFVKTSRCRLHTRVFFRKTSRSRLHARVLFVFFTNRIAGLYDDCNDILQMHISLDVYYKSPIVVHFVLFKRDIISN